jgi:hypothetical protein
MSLTQTENSHIQSEPKTLFISPLSNYKKEEKEEIIENVDNFFIDESKYLDLNSGIFVGKKPEGPKLDKNDNLIYYSYVGSPQVLTKIKGSKTINKRYSQIRKNSDLVNQKKKDLFQYIDNNGLNTYFQNIKERTLRNKKYENDIVNLPTPIKKQLINQQKNLSEQKREENSIKKMENYLIKKTNKKRENLLLKNYDSFQIKKGILRNIEEKEPLELKMGDKNWYFNLRRPKNFKGIRDVYINIRTNENPFWGRFFETCPKNIMRSRKPKIHSNDIILNLEKNPYLPKILNGNSTVNEIKKMENLEIKGKNLLDFETTLELNSPGRKKIYNRDQLETYEVCKDMSQPEYEKYLQILNEDKIFVNDFDIRDFCRYKSCDFSNEGSYNFSTINSSRL